MNPEQPTDDPHDGAASAQHAASKAEQFWEKHYRGREQVFSGKPKPLLVEVAGPLPADTALDLG